MKYIFLLNMGGANNLDECGEFLRNMFADENILRIANPWRFLLARTIAFLRTSTMQQNYRAIGGKSRLSELERSLCEQMSALTCGDFGVAASAGQGGDFGVASSGVSGCVVDFISTYVSPRASSVLDKYRILPDDEIVLIPLYPHFSTTTVRSSLQDFMRAYKAAKLRARVLVVKEFYKEDEYTQILLRLVREAAASFCDRASDDKSCAKPDALIVSAHSLPVSIIKAGDPYERQIREHFSVLKTALKDEFGEIRLAFQSKLGPVKWLEPSVASVLADFKGARVLILPLSFCIDCSETDYELAIEYAAAHRQNGGEIKICACCNDELDFARFLLRLASQAVAIEDYKY